MKKNLGIFAVIAVVFIVTAIGGDGFLSAFHLYNLVARISLYAIIGIGVDCEGEIRAQRRGPFPGLVAEVDLEEQPRGDHELLFQHASLPMCMPEPTFAFAGESGDRKEVELAVRQANLNVLMPGARNLLDFENF